MYFPNASLQAQRTGSDRLEPEAKQINPPTQTPPAKDAPVAPDRYTTSNSAGSTVWTAEWRKGGG